MKDIHNISLKDKPKNKQEFEDDKFSKLVMRLKANPDNTVLVNNQDGVLNACFVSLGCQREWFEKYVSLANIDATY